MFKKEASKLLMKNNELIKVHKKFLNLLVADFELNKISKKIDNWSKLEWNTLLIELKKQKVQLKGELKDDWYDRFHRFKKQALEIQEEISKTDKEIDRMVYELYELTPEEIEIVEKSIK